MHQCMLDLHACFSLPSVRRFADVGLTLRTEQAVSSSTTDRAKVSFLADACFGTSPKAGVCLREDVTNPVRLDSEDALSIFTLLILLEMLESYLVHIRPPARACHSDPTLGPVIPNLFIRS